MEKAQTPYETDISGQPAALRAFAASALPPELARLRLEDFERVLLTGMGSSHVAAHPTWCSLVTAGFPVWWVSAAQLLALQRMITNDTLLWVTSQSGESAEIVALTQAKPAHRPGTLLAATNDPGSTLAQAADIVIALESGDEYSVSTKTYVTTLAAHARVLAALTRSSDNEAVERVLVAADELERFNPELADLASSAVGSPMARFALIASSSQLPSALVGALVLKEAAKVPAEGFLRGEFRHGPLELAGPELSAVLFGSGTSDGSLEQLRDVLLQSGALVLHIDPGTTAPSASQTISTEATNALSRLVCGAKLSQLLSVELARARGIEPGTFRFGSKVTVSV